MTIDKDNIKILLIILVLGLGIGYAYINSDLNINGTAQVNHANWDVHWANVQVSTGSVSASSPTISNGTTVNYSVTLPTPGSYYEFTVDAVNAGSIDAMIDTISSKLNGSTITTLPAYLKYDVTYSSGIPLEPNHELKANTTEKYKVRIEYNTEVNQNQLPTTDQTLNLQFTVTYRQANESAMPVSTYLYSDTIINIGQSVSNIGIYNSAETLIEETEKNAFIRALISNDQVVGASLGFIYNNNVYYITGADEGRSYESNKALLTSIFGSSNCEEHISESDSTYKEYTCGANSMNVNSYSDGYVTAGKISWHCTGEQYGHFYCIHDAE